MANKDLDIVKQPHTKTSFTSTGLTDLLQCMDDPLYFMKTFMKVQHPIKGAMAFEPYPFQERLVNAFHNNRFSIALTARQMGKALSLQTPIFTSQGWKCFGDIRVGDVVFGDDGKPTFVSFVTDTMYDHVCYSLLFDTGETVVADEDHLWRVRFDSEQELLTTKQIVDRGILPVVDGKDRVFKIVSIAETASVPVRCIRVENDSHMFLCGKSMIPTHNTTVAAGYLLWRAMFTPDTTILIVANNLNGALEIMSRVRYAYENLPNHIRAGITEYNKGSISFDNGSRIVSRATSPDAARGLSITLLYCDEFAFLRTATLARDFWTSVQPTLSTGGSCIITSTPKSDEDQFAQIWKGATDTVDDYGNPNEDGRGKNGFFAVKVPWNEHPERDEAWAKPFRETLGEARFAQEFECCVGETTVQVKAPDGIIMKVTIQELMRMMS